MFFQKNIFEDLGLGRRLKVSRTTCYIIFSFLISAFIFYFFIYYYFHRSCVLTICLSYDITSIWASYSAFSRSHTRIRWSAKRKRRKKKKKAERTKWRSTQRCVFQTCYRASICWLHHRFTSIDVVDSEGRGEAGEVKVNSSLRSSDLWAFNMLTTS